MLESDDVAFRSGLSVEFLFDVLDVLVPGVLASVWFCFALTYTIFSYNLITSTLRSSNYFSHFSTLSF